MTEEMETRLVEAFERIAEALAGIHETTQRALAKHWPEPKERREAVVSRVPTEEDLIRERHGAGDKSTDEWLTLVEEEAIGEREREFLARQKEAEFIGESGEPVAAAGGGKEPNSGSAETLEGQA